MEPYMESYELSKHNTHTKPKKQKKKAYLDDNKEIYAIFNPGWTEFDLHARLMLRIGAAINGYIGFETKSEVGLAIGKRRTIIDIMIFRHEIPVCGVEVKKNRIMSNPDQFKKQMEFYQDFHRLTGIPIYYCQGFNNIKPIAHEVNKYIHEQYGAKKIN